MEDIYVELDQPRRLHLTLKAAKALSRACDGRGLIHVNSKLQEFDIDTLERVLWAAMSEDEPSLSLALTSKRVESYFDREKTLVPLFMDAARAIEASGLFNQPEGSDVEGKQQATTTP